MTNGTFIYTFYQHLLRLFCSYWLHFDLFTHIFVFLITYISLKIIWLSSKVIKILQTGAGSYQTANTTYEDYILNQLINSKEELCIFCITNNSEYHFLSRPYFNTTVQYTNRY